MLQQTANQFMDPYWLGNQNATPRRVCLDHCRHNYRIPASDATLRACCIKPPFALALIARSERHCSQSNPGESVFKNSLYYKNIDRLVLRGARRRLGHPSKGHHHHRVGAKRSGAIWGESHWLVTFLLLKRHCAIQLESVFKNCLYFKNITPKGCATLFGSSKGSSSQQGQKKWSDLETKFIHQLHDLHRRHAAAAAAAAAA
jgi:hypothetical protein